MTREEMQQLLDYNAWAHARVWSCINTLTDEQFNRNVGYAFEHIRGQVTHCMNVERRWAVRLTGQQPPERLTTDDAPSIAAVRQLWDVLQAETRALLDGLTEDDLEQYIEYDVPQRGGKKRDLRSDIVRHMINHGTDHRAQILAMLYMLGAKTLEQDLLIYIWEQQDQLEG
jgi:uncharacterized damage-inducible protein DinB